MATKRKRSIPAAVQEQLERKRRLSGSLAVRQGAALGKSARERLQPLIEAAPVAPQEIKFMPRFDLSNVKIDLDKMLRDQFRQMASSMMMPSVTFSFDSQTPTIDTGKFEALKAATPYKVQPQVPDMVQVLTGWRGWKLRGSRLQALGQSTTWPAKQAIEAICESGGQHLSPCWHCSCGIWAFKDTDRLLAAIDHRYSDVKVIGSVSLWGKVIETENGYRAQYAYPSELWLLDDSLEELGLIYDVPVRKAG